MSGKKLLKPGSKSKKNDHDRYAAADAAMAGGGYSAVKARPAPDRRAPTSFNLTAADRERITRLQGRLMSQGQQASKTYIVSLALKKLEDSSAGMHRLDE